MTASRSGTPTTTNDARKRPMVTITLPPEIIGKLERLAVERNESKSAVVAGLIRRARVG